MRCRSRGRVVSLYVGTCRNVYLIFEDSLGRAQTQTCVADAECEHPDAWVLAQGHTSVWSVWLEGGSVRLRSVSLISGSPVQDISIGHQQGPRWLCSAASSCTEPVTLLFYSGRGRAPSLCCVFLITLCERSCKNNSHSLFGGGRGFSTRPGLDRWMERKFINSTSETSKRGAAVFCLSGRVVMVL